MRSREGFEFTSNFTSLCLSVRHTPMPTSILDQAFGYGLPLYDAPHPVSRRRPPFQSLNLPSEARDLGLRFYQLLTHRYRLASGSRQHLGHSVRVHPAAETGYQLPFKPTPQMK